MTLRTSSYPLVPTSITHTVNTANMTDQFLVLKKKYTYNVPAAALFFSSAHKALRVEVPDIGKEFTDSAYIGKGGSSRIPTVVHYNL